MFLKKPTGTFFKIAQKHQRDLLTLILSFFRECSSQGPRHGDPWLAEARLKEQLKQYLILLTLSYLQTNEQTAVNRKPRKPLT